MNFPDDETYIDVGAGYPTGPDPLGADADMNTFGSGWPVFTYIWAASYFVAVVTYMKYYNKFTLEPAAGKPITVNGGETVMMSGHRSCLLGDVCYYGVYFATVMGMIWYLLLIVDAYNDCEIKGIDTLCWFGDFVLFGTETNDQWIFFTWWCCVTSWNIFLFVHGRKLRNFFRIDCEMSEAEFITCTKKQEVITMSNPSRIILFFRDLASKVFAENVLFFSSTVPVETVPVSTLAAKTTSVRLIEFMCTKFVYVDKTDMFEPSRKDIPATYGAICKLEGLTQREAECTISTMGRNTIPFGAQNWEDLILEEFTSYLYLYQFTIYSISYWFGGSFWLMPQMIACASSGLLKVYITRKNQKKIESMTMYSTLCDVIRDGKFVSINSEELVPGDLVHIAIAAEEPHWVIPCDLVLVKGTCICDESGLTGESMPISKSELPVSGAETLVYSTLECTKHTLYAGTTLLQAGSTTEERVLAVVAQTGIHTQKGELIGHILFPNIMQFQYDEELLIVFTLQGCYAVIVFIIAIVLQVWSGAPLSFVSMFAFAAATVSQCLPPLLPVALVLGYTMAARRLEGKKLCCVNPKRIVISGKIKAFMFDKTGTLTKSGLSYLGVRKVTNSDEYLLGLEVDSEESASQAEFVKTDDFTSESQKKIAQSGTSADAAEGDKLSWALATCHAVTELRTATGKVLVGNQVEVKMFESCGWELATSQSKTRTASGKETMISKPAGVPKEYAFSSSKLVLTTVESARMYNIDSAATSMASIATIHNPKTAEFLYTLKRFEFDHHTMTMSVLVRDTKGVVHFFCKGAPEKIGDLCESRSLPATYSGVSANHALDGCYVLALSYRCLGHMDDTTVAQLQRTDIEKPGELKFLGLILFRNEIKPDTAQAIAQLAAGEVRTVMVTGDNAHCGYYIAKQAGLVAPETALYLTEVEKDGTVLWTNLRDQAILSGETAEEREEKNRKFTTDQVLSICSGMHVAPESSKMKAVASAGANAELAITGKAMSKLEAQGRLSEVLLHTRIWARTSPDQKVQVIDLHIERGFITGMCGDGGNDCGALRAAHAGIALSDAEASAVSPFTSATKSVQSCVDLVAEGRCALPTSFSAYRFYIMYGLLWSMSKTLNFVYGVRMPIIGYVMVDAILAVSVAWAITLCQPLDDLLPYRPTSSLFAPQIVISVLGPWFIWSVLLGVALSLQYNNPDHVDFPKTYTESEGYWTLGDTWESTVFTMFMVMPMLWSGTCYCIGTKFHQPVWFNIPMMVVVVVGFTLFSYNLLSPANDWTAFFHVASNPFNGYFTQSPVWIRWQYPQGCATLVSKMTALSAAALAEMCADDRADFITYTVSSCGDACDGADPEPQTPGMPAGLRANIYVLLLVGMALTLALELYLEHRFVVPDETVHDLCATHEKSVEKKLKDGSMKSRSYKGLVTTEKIENQM